MITRALTVAAFVAVLSSPSALAQTARALPYGSSGVFNTALDPSLSIRLAGDNNDRIELRGGFTGEIAVLAVSAAPAELALGCCATIYVAAPIVSVVGQFGPGSSFSVSFNPAAPGLQGVALYMQGVDVLAGGGLSLSEGLRVSFGEGGTD